MYCLRHASVRLASSGNPCRNGPKVCTASVFKNCRAELPQGCACGLTYAEGGARSGRYERRNSSLTEIWASGGPEILKEILRTAILDWLRHGFISPLNRHLKGAANFDEWPADISSTAELPSGPFWIRIGRKLHWTMPSTNTLESRSRQRTYRRLGVGFGFMHGRREPAGGCDNVSRLASCWKMCQEFSEYPMF